MIEIEFIQDFKKCRKKGDREKVHPHFAQVLIEQGLAKAVNEPKKNKMIGQPVMEK
jgi:hypothetical protein